MSISSKIENGRAEFAYKCCEEALELGVKDAKEYKSHIKRFPMLIHTNGLGAAMAFVFSKRGNKKDNAYNKIYEQINKWFEQKGYKIKGEDISKVIISVDSYKYKIYTLEVIALCSWIKRFTEGIIVKESEDDTEG